MYDWYRTIPSIYYTAKHIVDELLLKLDSGLAAGQCEVATAHRFHVVDVLGLEPPPGPQVVAYRPLDPDLNYDHEDEGPLELYLERRLDRQVLYVPVLLN